MKEIGNESFMKLRVDTLERENKRMRELLAEIGKDRPRHYMAGSYWVQMFHDDFEKIEAMIK